jgi:hypothetical protein
MDTDRYRDLSKVPNTYLNTKIIAYIPIPSETEYLRGYVVRYFIQKLNDTTAPIYEIKTQAVSKFSANPFYVTVSLDWRITGTREEIKASNSESVRIASNVIPKLQLYLPNLLQFYKH